jgi:hypothetical protein
MGLMNGDEAVHLVKRLQDGEVIVLTPQQYLEMATLLYNMKDCRWVDPITRLWGVLDDLQCFDTDGITFMGTNCFDRIEEHYKKNQPYRTGSYYKTLNDEETLKKMGEKGKTDENIK